MSKRAPGRKPRVQYSSGKDHRRTISAKEARVMGTIGKRILTVAVGLLLAAGIPYVAATTLHADPGSGSECKGPCGEKAGGGHGAKCDCGGHKGMHDGMQCMKGGQMPCKQMGGGAPMMEGRTRHVEEMRGTIAKL